MNEKHYDLRFLPLFEDDLNEIVDYITYRLRNPAAAERLVDDVEAAILERLPCAESFEPFHSARERQYPYYRIQVRNFTVFYVVIGNIMEVRRICIVAGIGKNSFKISAPIFSFTETDRGIWLCSHPYQRIIPCSLPI